MKYSNLSLIYCLFIILLLGCKSSEETELETEACVSSEGKVTIMPLGASRVQGFRPVFESYRYALWKEIINGDWSVDFVGTQKDIALYDSHQNYCFDYDHEGHSGWTSAQVNNQIGNWLNQTETPDIVLFSSPGGNDALQGASLESILPNINAIIDKIQAHYPNVTILIEQLAPAKSTFMNEELTAIFEQIQTVITEIAHNQTTATSKVIPVDMATGFSDDFLADNVHYNTAGAQFIAEKYYDKLIPYLEK